MSTDLRRCDTGRAMFNTAYLALFDKKHSHEERQVPIRAFDAHQESCGECAAVYASFWPPVEIQGELAL